MSSNKLNLIGQKYNRLLVIQEVGISKGGSPEWLCLCDCGSTKIVTTNCLRQDTVKSCGCLNIESLHKGGRGKKYNVYDLSGEFGVGYTNKGFEFYFDLEDYGKIKNISWFIDGERYVHGNIPEYNKRVRMHRVILNLTDEKIKVDHIDRQRNNNRKYNLRTCDDAKNSMNQSLRSTNTSGIIGVIYYNQKWVAQIMVNYKHIGLGSYINISDAITARLRAEKEYFGEFAPQKHLFEQFNV